MAAWLGQAKIVIMFSANSNSSSVSSCCIELLSLCWASASVWFWWSSTYKALFLIHTHTQAHTRSHTHTLRACVCVGIRTPNKDSNSSCQPHKLSILPSCCCCCFPLWPWFDSVWLFLASTSPLFRRLIALWPNCIFGQNVTFLLSFYEHSVSQCWPLTRPPSPGPPL